MFAGVAGAATPFGGDDTGFIPPDGDNLRYESKVANLVSKFQACVLKCHAKRAQGKLTDAVLEEACETACEAKYDLGVGKLTAPPPASSCLNPTSVRSVWEGVLDANNGQIYCAGSEPVGGDDTGFVAPDKPTFKCESKVGKNLGKLLKCQTKCHARRAREQLDPAGEETCEQTCQDRYNAANAKLTDCPACSTAAQPGLGSLMRALGDAHNGLVYCAQ